MPPPVSEAAPPLISKDPQALAKQVKDNLGDELHRIDCTKPFVVKYVPLAQLAAWPEFKVEWTPRWIRIGCVLTEVPEPKLQTPTSRLVVNGYYPNINALPQAVVDAVASFLVSSFAVAAVAGLVLSEFARAVKVFRLLEPTADYPPVLQNSFFGVSAGSINYNFSPIQLEPGNTVEAIKVPHTAVRITLYG